MIRERRLPARRDRFGRTINRDHSPLLVHAIPLATILIGSLAPMLPIIAAAPVLPPFGFMIFLGWQLVRPGVLPLWIGLPLGAFDDLFSGQPFGSGILLWSLTMLALEAIEGRFPWRGFWQDWLSAGSILAAYLALAAVIAGSGLDLARVPLVIPQLLLSVLLFPIVARMVAVFDRLRLLRVRVIN